MSAICLFHALFYCAFALRVLAAPAAPAGAPRAQGETRDAPRRRALVAAHAAGFGLMYFGIGDAVLGRRPSALLLWPQPLLGGAVIALATALVAWSLAVFRSWRLEARIEAGHELCTAGPFGFVRHPIYLATALLNLGSFLWIPTGLVAAGGALSVIAADQRARAEERVLLDAFGDAYRDYAGRVKRFLPGVY